jgi:Ca2+-dependent lipid-binding protein
LDGDVPVKDIGGKCDPYVIFKLGVKVYKSKIIKKTLTPTWNQRFQILIYPEELK